MAQMLRHKETGELFIYTPALATLSELELVVEDPVAKVLAEIKAEAEANSEPEEAAGEPELAPIDELEAALGDTFDAPAPAPAQKKKQNRFGK